MGLKETLKRIESHRDFDPFFLFIFFVEKAWFYLNDSVENFAATSHISHALIFCFYISCGFDDAYFVLKPLVTS